MIEIKLSQGSKPGHGGILPAIKNTKEIARERQVEPGKDIVQPAQHSAFQGPEGLLKFVQQLRDLSGGKPIGFKLCLGRPEEFAFICQAMHRTGIKPDFITVDGGEGGTGASPLEYANSIGYPLREGLATVVDILVGYDVRDDICVFASGKVLTGFDLIRVIALGADGANSARGMMFALGCIMALECNKNTCPTGVTTQDPKLRRGLVVEDKRERVARFHQQTIDAATEILSASGYEDFADLHRGLILRRTSETRVSRLSEVFPPVERGCLLRGDIPEQFRPFLEHESAD